MRELLIGAFVLIIGVLTVLNSELKDFTAPKVPDGSLVSLPVDVPAPASADVLPVPDGTVSVPAGFLDMSAKFQLFRSIGATVPEAILADALCTAENRQGNPNAVNQNRPPYLPDYGICQVNGMHVPELAPSIQSLFDPVVNARASLTLLRRDGPKAWCTYPGGCNGQPGVKDWAAIFAQATAIAAGFGG